MRLIDADELKEQLKERYEKSLKWRSESLFCYDKADGEVAAYLEAIMTLNNVPTVDAVPVLRCKDCRYAEEDLKYPEYRYCRLHEQSKKENGFCDEGVYYETN